MYLYNLDFELGPKCLLWFLVFWTTNYENYRKLLRLISSGIWCCLMGNGFPDFQRNILPSSFKIYISVLQRFLYGGTRDDNISLPEETKTGKWKNKQHTKFTPLLPIVGQNFLPYSRDIWNFPWISKLLLFIPLVSSLDPCVRRQWRGVNLAKDASSTPPQPQPQE